MKTITLTQEKIALVDDDDYEYLNKFKWYAVKNQNTFYARTKIDGVVVLMRRVILKCTKGDGKIIDHIDSNGLNNQKSNIQFCTTSQNQAKANPIRESKASKYYGVCLKRTKRNKNGEIHTYEYWMARVGLNNKSIHVGYFKTQEEAALAYNKKAIEIHGQFARLNVIK